MPHDSRVLPDGLRHVTLDADGQFPALAIDIPACTATVAMQGAQLLAMQPRDAAPLLWLSPGAACVPGRAVRGGIPLCFPWFGPHPDDPAKPAHGFARNRPWTLEDARVDAGGAHLLFALEDDAATRALWPHAFRATLRMSLGAGITQTLSVTNRGATEVSFGFAFHTYFPVDDVGACRVEGLEGTAFTDPLSSGASPRNEAGAIRFHAETDRVYQGAEGRYRLVDERTSRVIRIDAPDCRSAIVWNPWQEKAARLGDVPGGSWRQMVCVECGNVGDHTVPLAAGGIRTFRMDIGWDR